MAAPRQHTVAARGRETRIYLQPGLPRAARRAADDFRRDLAAVCGCRAVFCERAQDAGILVGMLEQDGWLEALADCAAFPVKDILDENGAPRWEAYLHGFAPDGRLVIAGSGRRGVIYGLYDLSRRFGVSPWYDLADVPVRRAAKLTLPAGYQKADWPAVQYRGIFLNDEEELCAWARAHTPDGTIGPAAYRRIFELLLRLKGNYIWPAMHVNAFNTDPENGRLADEMGIVVGTSHCDMLLRSNQNEWEPWVRKKRYAGLRYDYSLPGQNRERLREYWRESVEQNRGYEVCWTLGMRGIHDSGFLTQAIDEDDTLTEAEKAAARVRLLEEVIRDQRAILREVLGEERAQNAPQIFVPYKEVLPLYDSGLRLPENVTVMWADDNFGHVRRYPSPRERRRAGGSALYYHSSYWSPAPLSYLFIASAPLAQTGCELRKAYAEGIRKIWVDNVGALKPLEQDMEYFLQYGWDAARPGAAVHDVRRYLEEWFDGIFPGGIGAACADIYEQYTLLTDACKVEHLYRDAFSQTAWGDEGGRRLQGLKAVYDRALAVQDALPLAFRDAFFELLGMKVCAAFYIGAAFYYADRSRLCFRQGKMQGADRYLARARRMMGRKRQLLHFYNKTMAQGKWDGILTPEVFPPPPSCLYTDAKPALRVGAPGLGVIVWGAPGEQEDPVLTFDAAGARCKWFELFNKGRGRIRFRLENGCAGWLALSALQGTVEDEVRILADMRGTPRAGHIDVWDEDAHRRIRIRVEPAADGRVSFAAAEYARMRGPAGGWTRIPGLGRTAGGCMEAAGGESALEYDFVCPAPGPVTVEVTRYLTLTAKGRIRLEVWLDGACQTVESAATDEWRGGWEQAVRDDGETLRCTFPQVGAGPHTLALRARDPYLTLGRITVYFAGADAIPPCHLGPEPPGTAKNEALPLFDEAALDADCDRRYRIRAAQVPPVGEAVAGHGYWAAEHLFQLDTLRPRRPAPPRYRAQPDGGKDLLAQFPRGAFAEKAGRLCLEAEYALRADENAWHTPDAAGVCWEHLAAETDGGTGLAMAVLPPRLAWAPAQGPALHYRLRIQNGGRYFLWLLVRFDDTHSDACQIGLDGMPQPMARQYCARGRQSGAPGLFTFSTQGLWFWTLFTETELAPGEHVLDVYAVRAGLRIDRLYLTLGTEPPPDDADWAVLCEE